MFKLKPVLVKISRRAISTNPGSETCSFLVTKQTWYHSLVSCFYADASFTLPVGDNEDEESLVSYLSVSIAARCNGNLLWVDNSKIIDF